MGLSHCLQIKKTHTIRTAGLRALLLNGALILVVACSSNDIKDEEFFEPAKLQKFDKKVELKRNWSTSVGNGQGKKSFVRLIPSYHVGSVYAAAHDGIVQKLDAVSGKKQWQVKTKMAISGAISVEQDQVFLGTLQGEAVALSAADGSELWRTPLSSEVLSAPHSNGSIAVVHCFDGKVYGLRHDNGEKVWEYESQNPKLTLRGTAAPLIVEDLAVIALANGKLVALDIETGTMRWEQRVAIAKGRSEIERMVDVDGAPISDGPLVFAVSYQGRLIVVEAASGRVLWRKDASSSVSLAQGFGNVYVAEANGSLSAYKVNDGSLQWQQEALEYRKLSAPATIGAYTAVADYDGYLHLLSQVDGQLAGRLRIDGAGVRSPLISYDSSLLVYSNSGRLVSYSVKE